jgi:hypothetical protein
MAAISITAGNVIKSTGAITEAGWFGETVTAGQTVYKDSSDGQFYLADCDATAVAGESQIDNVHGIALNGGAVDQPAVIQKSGKITIGGTAVVAMVYVQSATAGGITALADIANPDYITVIGVATTAGVLDIDINRTGVVVPA